jgi:hypothetical protein
MRHLSQALAAVALLIVVAGCDLTRLPKGCPPTCAGVNLHGRDLARIIHKIAVSTCNSLF